MALGRRVSFEVGTPVQLVNGGPTMTVGKDDGSVIWCIWFDGNVRQDAQFPVETLKRVAPAL